VGEDLLENVKINEELWLEKKNVQIHRAFLKLWNYFEESEDCQDCQEVTSKEENANKKFDRKLQMKK